MERDWPRSWKCGANVPINFTKDEINQYMEKLIFAY